MKEKLKRCRKKLFVTGMVSVMFLMFGACGREPKFDFESFEPIGNVIERTCSFETGEASEPVVYDIGKLTEFKNMMKEYHVEYGYDELFDYEKATGGVTADHVVQVHAYSALDADGRLTKEHLYKIVRKNNEAYLKDATSIIKEVDKKLVLEICGIITDVTNDMLAKYPDIDRDRVYCNLGNLKIVEKVSALDYAAVEAEMVLHINRGTAVLLNSNSKASMYQVIVHETMHILQFGCSCEMKNGCERRCGLAHYYPDWEPQYADWIWLGEGSAERMACLYIGTEPMTYMNHVNYIRTLDLAITLREDIPENYIETIYFFDDVKRLYDAAGAVTEEEKQEIYKMIYALDIMQTEPEGIKDAYKKNYGIEWTDAVRDDVFNQVKRPVLKTITKLFFVNLADVILKSEVSKNDVLFLVNLYESTINQHLHLDNKKYDAYNAEFSEWYKSCRTAFFEAFENVSPEEYAVYDAMAEENTINATMKWFAKEKQELLIEKYEANACEYKME